MSGVACSHHHGCITCGDVGVALTVTALEGSSALALCEDESGAHESVDISLVEHVRVGDRVLAHAGVALARLEARR